MDINKKLEELQKIKAVDAPEFLFTRIRQKVFNLPDAVVTTGWKWIFAAASVCILALNIFAFASTDRKETNTGINSVVSSMKLSGTNELYHE